MYIHLSLDTKPMILSMDALKLMLFSYNVLDAIDVSHQPVAIFPVTPILVVLLFQHSHE